MEEKTEKHGRLRQVLADNLLAQRHKLGLSQEAFADLAGLHRTYIGHIENCRQAVNLDNIERLAVALSVPAHVLLMPVVNGQEARPRRVAGSIKGFTAESPIAAKAGRGRLSVQREPATAPAPKVGSKTGRAAAPAKRARKLDKAL